MVEDERDLDAAERALGTLSLDAETAEDRARREAWERRLSPLLAPVAPAEPPDGLLDRIEARIDAASGAEAGAEVVDLDAMRRRVTLWKRATGFAAALAACLAAYIAVPLISPEPAPKYVAVVTSDRDGSTGLIVEFDTGTGIATVIPAGATVPEGRSLEMWHLPEGETTPRSLGLLPETAVFRQTFEAGPGDLFAISLEPEGGSPTGQPTEPIYHGQVIRVE